MDQGRHGWCWAAGLACGLAASAAGAQITVDGTAGTAAAQSGNSWSISAGTQVGGNLFHSFSAFGIPTGHSATFSGATSVQNIISRVTGAGATSIDGLLRSTIPGANFWLINPNGVTIGANATLDVRGSFHVSTADYLSLGAGGRFDASNPAATVLVSASPSAFGFVRAAPAPVTLEGAGLELRDGMRFGVAGGDIRIDGVLLNAVGGSIQLAALAGPGEVALGSAGIALAGQPALGRIDVTGSLLNVSSVELDGVGDIVRVTGLPAGSIALRAGSLAIVGSALVNLNAATAAAAGIDIQGDGDVRISGSFLFSDTFGPGAAGPISIRAGRLVLEDFSRISSSTFGAGAGGDVTLAASESIHIASDEGAVVTLADDTGPGGSIHISAPLVHIDGLGAPFFDEGTVDAGTEWFGRAGNVTVEAATLRMINNASISTSTDGPGTGGNIVVRASELVSISGSILPGDEGGGLFAISDACGPSCGAAGSITIDAPLAALRLDDAYISSTTFSSGAGGSVDIRVREFTLTGGGLVSTSAAPDPTTPSVAPTGSAGELRVSAGRLEILAGPTVGSFPAGLYSAVDAGTSGDAGLVEVHAGALTITGGVITSTSRGNGAGGDVSVRADTIVMREGGKIVADTELTGAGGSVLAAATLTIDIDGANDRADSLGGPSGIFARSFGTGNAGAVTAHAGESLRMTGGASIATRALSADGGDIVIQAGEILYLKDSSITTSVGTGEGNGGNIAIDPVFVVLDESSIVANAFGGNGGNISIVSQFLLSSPGSVIDASSALGISGGVSIAAPEVDLGAGLAALPSGFFDASGLIRQSCASRAQSGASTLIGAGRGGLAADPFAPGAAPGAIRVVAMERAC